MYWWQGENRGQRAKRLLTQLTVDLGRLPTFEEAAASDETLVHDAAVYYGSFRKLLELVAGALYGSSLRTYPTEKVKMLGGRASEDDVAKLQAKYEERLREMALEPKDPKRLTEPAPLPESKVVSTPKRSSETTVASTKLSQWNGRRITDLPDFGDIMPKTEVAQEVDHSDMAIVVDTQKMGNLEVDERRCADDLEATAADNRQEESAVRHDDALVQDVLQEVVEQVIDRVADEAVKVVLDAEMAEKSVKEVEKVAGKRTVSKEVCIGAVRQAYAAIGEKAWRQKDYAIYASHNGLPAVATMIKNLGRQKTWRQYLEEVAEAENADIVDFAGEAESVLEDASDGSAAVGETGDISRGESDIAESAIADRVESVDSEEPENGTGIANAEESEHVMEPASAEGQTEMYALDPDCAEEASEAFRESRSKAAAPVKESIADSAEVIEVVATGQVKLQTKLNGRPTTIVLKLGND